VSTRIIDRLATADMGNAPSWYANIVCDRDEYCLRSNVIIKSVLIYNAT
jgi:hypothetical protein